MRMVNKWGRTEFQNKKHSLLPWGHWLWILCVACVSTLILIAVIECSLRLIINNAYFSPPIFKPATDEAPYGLVSSKSSRVHQFGRLLDVDSDQFGNRRTVGISNNADAKLHLIGDSQIFGWGLSDEETVASQLQKFIGDRVQVVNHGVPGYGSYEYIEVLKKIPINESVIVFHTEENDTWDAYNLFRTANVQCGYLVTIAGSAHSLLCGVIDLRIVQGIFELWDQFQHWHRPTPLGFSPRTEVVAIILNNRIADLFALERKHRGNNLAFSIIPWKGRYSSEWLQRYTPALAVPANTIQTPFFDNTDMLSRFAEHHNAVSLYLKGDSHLSPEGSRYVAENLAEFAVTQFIRN